jgi:hypothetical protein
LNLNASETTAVPSSQGKGWKSQPSKSISSTRTTTGPGSEGSWLNWWLAQPQNAPATAMIMNEQVFIAQKRICPSNANLLNSAPANRLP